jgi:formamidopyrimidine-DNA glycosylase
MPELPEVELVRRSLLPLRGRRIEAVEVLQPSILSTPAQLLQQTIGSRIIEVRRRGKQIFILLEEGVITLHLGMTGEVSIGAISCDKHVAVRLSFDDGTWLNYVDPRRFGAVGHAASVEAFVRERGLGEDILEIDLAKFTGRVMASRRAVKTILLDQGKMAGIGNLYADEALFQVRLHPLRQGSALNERQTRALWRAARRVIRRSLSVGTDFSSLPRLYLLRDRAGGHPCPRCHGPLASLVVGGRTSIFCPICQFA